MAKHVEMIIDYVEDESDYQYHDNHGLLIRCSKCVYAQGRTRQCFNEDGLYGRAVDEDDYCSRAKMRKEK